MMERSETEGHGPSDGHETTGEEGGLRTGAPADPGTGRGWGFAHNRPPPRAVGALSHNPASSRRPEFIFEIFNPRPFSGVWGYETKNEKRGGERGGVTVEMSIGDAALFPLQYRGVPQCFVLILGLPDSPGVVVQNVSMHKGDGRYRRACVGGTDPFANQSSSQVTASAIELRPRPTAISAGITARSSERRPDAFWSFVSQSIWSDQVKTAPCTNKTRPAPSFTTIMN
ncbi:hypothetical protein EDB86DRAFT_2831549 [Lactarius hatsudake]|nr:hypothetical protein EDB86DRAFT_2831549 [Lactarius hatsudake]